MRRFQSQSHWKRSFSEEHSRGWQFSGKVVTPVEMAGEKDGLRRG